MTEDARFEEAADGPLRLRAEGAEDLPILAALAQDAVVTVGDLRFDRGTRQFAALITRFRWEDHEDAERAARPYERVRALLVVSDVLSVASTGFDRAQPGAVLSLLDIAWAAGDDGAGVLTLTLAGGGAIVLTVECLSVDLRDVTRPHRAQSARAPFHPDE